MLWFRGSQIVGPDPYVWVALGPDLYIGPLATLATGLVMRSKLYLFSTSQLSACFCQNGPRDTPTPQLSDFAADGNSCDFIMCQSCLSPNKSAFALMNLSVQRVGGAGNGSHIPPVLTYSLFRVFSSWAFLLFFQYSFCSFIPTFWKTVIICFWLGRASRHPLTLWSKVVNKYIIFSRCIFTL